MPTVYLNGEFIPREEAKISVLDRGFLFADALYEVIPVYQGKLFHATEHLQRLHLGLDALQIQCTLTDEQWLAIFQQLLSETDNTKNQQIYLQVSRGAGNERLHDFPEPPVEPTIYVQVAELKTLNKERLEQGLSAIIADDKRRHDCYIKMTGLMPNVLARHQAKQKQCDEAILVHNGIVTEGTSSNVFIVKDNIIKTHPSDKRILGGITRNFVIDLIAKTDYVIEEKAFGLADLLEADEVWITSSTKEVAPIIKVDDQPIAEGKIGPAWQIIYELFQQHK